MDSKFRYLYSGVKELSWSYSSLLTHYYYWSMQDPGFFFFVLFCFRYYYLPSALNSIAVLVFVLFCLHPKSDISLLIYYFQYFQEGNFIIRKVISSITCKCADGHIHIYVHAISFSFSYVAWAMIFPVWWFSSQTRHFGLLIVSTMQWKEFLPENQRAVPFLDMLIMRSQKLGKAVLILHLFPHSSHKWNGLETLHSAHSFHKLHGLKPLYHCTAVVSRC